MIQTHLQGIFSFLKEKRHLFMISTLLLLSWSLFSGCSSYQFPDNIGESIIGDWKNLREPFALHIEEDGRMEFRTEDGEVYHGYLKRGMNKLNIVGILAPESDCEMEKGGIYTFQKIKGNLSLIPVNEPCSERLTRLTGLWIPQK